MLTLTTGKRELVIDPPLMNAAGILGFSNEANSLVDVSRLGAFVTHPISLARRAPALGPRLIPFPGGFLLHTGWPNPGLTAVVRRHRRRWASLTRPVILHLLAVAPGEVARVVGRIESIEEIAGIELGLGEFEAALAADLVAAAVRSQLPVLAHLPMTTPLDIALAAQQAGAAGLVLGPARGALTGPAGTMVHGRLYGPAMFALALHATERLARQVGIPVISSGGVYSSPQTQALLEAGAAGVQFDSVLWTEPERVLTDAAQWGAVAS
jgi:dihydroorotate dehydrogenase (NAD+) catalytic subunit